MKEPDLLTENKNYAPLAARMRPKTVEEFVGQEQLLMPGKPLYQAIKSGKLHSMILWGPPGTGKTTLARLIAESANAHLEFLSAVMAGIKDIRAIVDKAKMLQASEQKPTVLFIDEVHRFNKTQQDAFLPFVEDGTLTLIGATTENPSFALNNALLSRTRVYVLKPLETPDLIKILEHALQDEHSGYGQEKITYQPEALSTLAQLADGDARAALNLLEIAISILATGEYGQELTLDIVQLTTSHQLRRFDKNDEYFYDLISALHKSVRGSDPNASLYWLARMLDGGCDPLYIARRVIRMASEDIGNADPRALTLATSAAEAFERLGSPEGELALAQAIVYCACAAKSNAVYVAFKTAMKDVKEGGTLEVPMYLRNAPTSLMKQLGYSKGYRYAHNEPHAYAAGEHYFPENMAPREYYQPVPRGLEQQIRDKLAFLKSLDDKENK